MSARRAPTRVLNSQLTLRNSTRQRLIKINNLGVTHLYIIDVVTYNSIPELWVITLIYRLRGAYVPENLKFAKLELISVPYRVYVL